MNPFTIFASGDAAVTCYFGNIISAETNQRVIAMQRWLQHNPPQGIKDIIVAYSSITIVYDIYLVKRNSKQGLSAYHLMTTKLEEAFEQSSSFQNDNTIKEIPVCYELPFAPDISILAEHKKLSIEEVVRFHTSEVYRVYMIGFLPGFPYMASVPDQISMSRKAKPKRSVAAGSVGIAGKQTGIYPVNSPGGWQIIGRTPLQLFNTNRPDQPVINTGDLVQFFSVSMKEFERLSMHDHK